MFPSNTRAAIFYIAGAFKRELTEEGNETLELFDARALLCIMETALLGTSLTVKINGETRC
jgi:hypothetical protein